MRGPSLAARLLAPVDVAAIVVYRILFGTLALWEVWRYADHGWIDRYYVEPGFHFTYWGFHWIAPWPGDGMHWHFAALACLAACIIVGFCYRAATALFFVGFSYVFLLERANYLNHLYLFCLIGFLMIFLPAHRDLSVDAWLRPRLRREDAPTWSLWLLRFQMGLVYFFAGLAKLNADWLAGWPLRLWLPPESDFPVIGRFFDEVWFAVFFSWGGLLLDLLVPFFLLWRPTRLPAFLLAVAFHLTNSRLFGIGIFPWLSIATTLVFFDADWPRRVFNWPRRTPPPPATPAPLPRLTTRRRAGLAALGLYVALQSLIPLRHFLLPGNVSWTEEGHDFAWHQKLRDKDGEATFTVTDPATGEPLGVRESLHLSRRQRRKMSTRPHLILEFAHHLARVHERRLGHPVEVRARVFCSLNGREPQLLVDPEVDLAAQSRNAWRSPWILPLEAGRR